MRASLLASTAIFTAMLGCGSKKSFDSLCQTQVPPPPACMTACDPTPGAADSCPANYHCTPDGMCDTECTPGGGECGSGYVCSADGYCVSDGGSDVPIDMPCPAVHFTAMPTIPSIQLLIDRSGSMDDPFSGGGASKYNSVRDALVGPNGAVTMLESQVYFGAALFSADNPCPTLYSVPRAMNNKNAIQSLIQSQNPGGNTPTPPSIMETVADFAANPPPMGSPPIIVLATDGLPNSCNGQDSQAESVQAAAASYAAGIRLFILSVGDAVTTQHLQAMANAGAGVMPGQPDAPYYVANSPAQLAMAFQQIIGGVLSCDLTLSGMVDPNAGPTGTVVLNGMTLVYGTDWTLDPDGLTIHILGNACTDLKSSTNPTVDASFSCGSVIF